jgi:hypothetical protein
MSVLPSLFVNRGWPPEIQRVRRRRISESRIGLWMIDTEEAAALFGPGCTAIG